MKNIWFFYIMVLTLISGLLHAQSGINLSHKSIGKEIRKTFKVGDYQLSNLSADDTTKSRFTDNEFFYIVKNNLNHLGFLYIGRVNCCRMDGCSALAPESEISGFEYFDYLILYDSLCTVTSVRVFNYQATHGYEICSSAWLKQFKGYKYGTKLYVGETVDAISGATISVGSITIDIERASAYLSSTRIKEDG